MQTTDIIYVQADHVKFTVLQTHAIIPLCVACVGLLTILTSEESARAACCQKLT